MIYTPLTLRAMRMAYEAHAGQTDKGGAPYIFHPMHVAEQMETEYETIAALLHDVLEDCDPAYRQAIRECFPAEVYAAVDAITKRDGEEYAQYVARVAADPIARRVKIADLLHNMDASRLCCASASASPERMAKYRAVLDKLIDMDAKQTTP